MMTITPVTVPIRGERSGRASATFAQQTLWGELAVLEPHTSILNIALQAPVPECLTLPDVLAAIGDLVLRHECLRTRYLEDERGVLWQELTGDGEFTAEVWDARLDEDVEAEVRRVVDDAELARYAPARPARVLVAAVGGTPVLVVLGMSHLVADMLGARLLRQDMADLLAARADARPAPALPTRRQSLDQAAIEQSPAGRRSQARAAASWGNRLESAPPTMFPVPPATDGAGFLHAVLTSQALPLAADAIGRRHRVSSAIAVMAAQAVMLGHQADADRCAILVSVGNRTAPEVAPSAGLFKQHSLAVIDLCDASFAEIVRRTWRAWLLAQRTGAYDPAEISERRRAAELSRGVALDLSCHFNDLRGTPQPVTEGIPAERITAAAAASTFSCEEIAAYYAKFQLRLKEEGQDVRTRHQPPPGAPRRVLMHAFADGRVLPKDRLRALMTGIERLLVWQATEADAGQPLDPRAITTATGMPAPAGRAGWLRAHGGLVEVAAVERLLAAAAAEACPRQVAAPPVMVLARPGQASAELVGYVAVRGNVAPTPEQLHHGCVARITGMPPHGLGWPSGAFPSYPPRWLSSVTPQRYVVCADVPGLPYDEAGWLARPVLAEGTGRPAGAADHQAARAS
jgi:hypothetical protein